MISLGEWAAQLRRASVTCKPRLEAVLVYQMDRTAEEARGYPGTYHGYWPPLAESTLAEKGRLGYSPPDNPLLRTGELKDSITFGSAGLVGYVGSSDPKAAFHEMGTARMPPRPIYALAMERRLPDIIEAFNLLAAELLIGTGRP